MYFNDSFDAIFDSMALGFGRPSKIIFNTNGLKDQMPSFWVKTENGYRCTAKTLGISEKDISVTVEDDGIKLFGESEVEGQKYNTTLLLPITDEILDSIIEIKTKTINGLTFIDLVVDKPKKKKILINGK